MRQHLGHVGAGRAAINRPPVPDRGAQEAVCFGPRFTVLLRGIRRDQPAPDAVSTGQTELPPSLSYLTTNTAVLEASMAASAPAHRSIGSWCRAVREQHNGLATVHPAKPSTATNAKAS